MTHDMPVADSEQGSRPIRSRVREQRSALPDLASSGRGSAVAASRAERQPRCVGSNCRRRLQLRWDSLARSFAGARKCVTTSPRADRRRARDWRISGADGCRAGTCFRAIGVLQGRPGPSAIMPLAAAQSGDCESSATVVGQSQAHRSRLPVRHGESAADHAASPDPVQPDGSKRSSSITGPQGHDGRVSSSAPEPRARPPAADLPTG
jgi:hypothetical protein